MDNTITVAVLGFRNLGAGLGLALPLPSPPFRSWPLNSSRGSGGALKLAKRGLGQSPSRNRIWNILALESDIMVATILMILVRINLGG